MDICQGSRQKDGGEGRKGSDKTNSVVDCECVCVSAWWHKDKMATPFGSDEEKGEEKSMARETEESKGGRSKKGTTTASTSIHNINGMGG